MADEREYFELLAAVLRRHGFGWVLAQAQAEIREGQAVTKEVRAPDVAASIDDDTFVRRTPRRRRAALVATKPFNAAERLDILIRGINAAIIDRVDLEEAVLKSVDHVSRIDFVPDNLTEDGVFFEEESRPHSVERVSLQRGLDLRFELNQALRQVREVTDVRAE